MNRKFVLDIFEQTLYHLLEQKFFERFFYSGAKLQIKLTLEKLAFSFSIKPNKTGLLVHFNGLATWYTELTVKQGGNIQMQTIYFTTSNFIRHEGNLVDLTEYRRKLALAQGYVEPVEEPEPQPSRTRTIRRRRTAVPGMMLDYAASIALIITALSFAAKIL